MSSGTHWRHICIMGHPGGLISISVYFGIIYIYVCTSACLYILIFYNIKPIKKSRSKSILNIVVTYIYIIHFSLN